MISDLTSALIKDTIAFLKQEKGFLSLSADQRQQKAPAYAALLDGMSESDFVNDLERTLKVLKGSLAARDSRLMQSLGRYFCKDFPAVFDQLDRDFYRLPDADQASKIEALLPEKERFFGVLRHYVSLYSPQEMTETIIGFLADIANSPRILVQSPVECDRETKTGIRQHFAQDHSTSFVAFSVNPQLIGGIRFFVDGKVDDHSWFSKIQSLNRLKAVL